MARALLGQTSRDGEPGTFPLLGEIPQFDALMGYLGGFLDPRYDGPLQFVSRDGTLVGPPGVGLAEALYANPHWGGMNDPVREQYADRAHNVFGAYS